MSHQVQSNPQISAIVAGEVLAIMASRVPPALRNTADVTPADLVVESKNRQFALPVSPIGQTTSQRKLILVPDVLRFRELMMRWKADTALLSSTTETVMHDAYQKIIGMGERALPFIFQQLESEGQYPDNWFWALRAITGEDPVPAEARGNRRAMAQAWLGWAHGRYAW